MHLVPLTVSATAATTTLLLAPRQTTTTTTVVTEDHGGTPPVGSLLTVFTPGPGCFPVTANASVTLDAFWSDTPSCAPPGYTSYYEYNDSPTFYYSPAICPSGFSSGCSRFDVAQGPTVEPTETAILCVLEGYECAPGWDAFYATNDDGMSQVMIEVRWAEADLTRLATHPLTPGLVPTDDPASSSSSSSSPAAATPATPSPTATAAAAAALSSGAKAGIGVGAGVGGAAIVSLAAFCIWRYRRRRRQQQHHLDHQQNGGGVHEDEKIPATQPPPPPSAQFPAYPSYLPPPPQGPAPASSSQGGGGGAYAAYVDPRTGVVSYYAPVPQPTELGGTAVSATAGSERGGGGSVVYKDPAPPPAPGGFGFDPPGPPAHELPSTTVPAAGAFAPSHDVPRMSATLFRDSYHPSPAPQAVVEKDGSEMGGGGGRGGWAVARSVRSSVGSQQQQEMAMLMAEQARLEAKRTRLLELGELDEEERRIQARMRQVQDEQ
ncbi:hypothetical protein F4780DRAFT_557963 [Xylariomycetidae sp. FL0641]|nr:hypothetical protein F4780DRAFT_557963 [Xylariomycetidae sp. FL0641]